jgi:vitamin B12 transport system substrate-binding protein
MKFSYYFYTVLLILACLNTAKEVNAQQITPIDKSKPRIIALSPHIVEMLFDIGAGEQIITLTTPQRQRKYRL